MCYRHSAALRLARLGARTYHKPMRYDSPLIPARLRKRYKRFLCDALLAEEREVTAHCPNPGSMLSLIEKDAEIWLSKASNPKRKLKFSWELIRLSGGLVGIHTGRANDLVAEAIAAGRVPELAGYASLRREVRYGKASRIDLLLEDDALAPCYVEIKSVTMSRQCSLAEFPDSVTARGAKHLDELSGMAAAGARAVLFFLVQRADCSEVAVAGDIDPHYAERLAAALTAGVEVISYCCNVTTEGIELDHTLPLRLETDIGTQETS